MCIQPPKSETSDSPLLSRRDAENGTSRSSSCLKCCSIACPRRLAAAAGVQNTSLAGKDATATVR